MASDFQSTVCISGAVLMLLFSLMAVVLNSCLLIVLYKDRTKSLKSTTSLYVTSLAILHLLFGSVVSTAAAESYITCAQDIEDTAHSMSAFSRISFSLLIRTENYVMLAFSVERLGNISYPVFHPRADKMKNTLIGLASIFVYSVGFSIFEIAAAQRWIRKLDLHFNVVIPLAATITLTALLYKALRRFNGLYAEQDPCDSSSGKKSRCRTRLKKQILLSSAFIFVILLFAISLLPYWNLLLYEVYCSNCTQHYWFFAAFRLCVAFTFLRTALTPSIYYIRIPEFRKGVKMVFCGMLEEQSFRVKLFNRSKNSSGKVTVIYL